MPRAAMNSHYDLDRSTTVETLTNYLNRFPKDAKVRAVAHEGDRPWDGGWVTIEVSWTEEVSTGALV